MTLDQILVEAYQQGHTYNAIFGAILGAVASVAGAALSSRKKKESTYTDATTTSTVNFKQLAKDAAKAGFNPLTALRSGAIGGYVTTHTKGENVTTSSGGGGVGAGIADAVAGIAPMFGNSAARADPIKTKSMTSGAVSSTVAGQVFTGGRPTGRTGSVVVAPRQTTVSSPVTRSQPSISGARLAPYLEDGKLTNTDVGKQFDWWESDPSRVDGAQYEDAYGEFIGGALGIVPFFQDAWHNAKRGKVYASDAWQRQKIASNYRTMAKRPVVDNRRPPPAGYRYAN